MRLTRILPALLGAALLACNDLDVGDLNDPGVNAVQASPTRAGVLNLATGLQTGSRYGVGQQNGYNALLGIVGREIYNFDNADPRFVTEMLIGPLDGGSPAFGGNLYGDRYSNLRTANVLLHAMANLTDDPQVGGMSAAEKEVTTGYVQTMEAYDYLRVVLTRDDLGAPTEVDIDPTATPAPIRTKQEVYDTIVSLLEQAKTHLQSGAADFPFPMSPGFSDFSTPATFLTFNRALRARVAAYLQDWPGVLAALGESFISPATPSIVASPPFALGAYHTFSTTAGDSTNNLFDPNTRALAAHPSMLTDAQLQVDGVTPDKRIVDKTFPLTDPKSVPQGYTSNFGVNVYTSPSAPIPIIRDEELVLLRAEANIQLNNLADAVTDLNLVRQVAGNLPAYSGPVTQPALIDELLYNRRYSLFFEGGHRWIDARRYGRLASLPLEPGTHHFSRFPFPRNECLARNPQPAAGCSPEPGSP